MRAMAVVMSDVIGQDLLEMSTPEDEEPIGALSADGADESLGERVRSWRSNGCLDDSDALGAEYLVEAGRELRVSVPDEELGCPRSACEVAGEVASLLDDPPPRWVGGDASQVDPSGVELDEEQYVEASEQHRVDGEEVAGQHCHCLRSQELRPRRPRSTRSGFDAMPAKDCPHARRGEQNSHRGQLPLDPPIAPGRVLSCQTKDQRD